MKKFAFIFPLLAFFFIFHTQTYADGYTFNAYNLTWNPTTKVVSFDISNLSHPVDWTNTAINFNDNSDPSTLVGAMQNYEDLSAACNDTQCTAILDASLPNPTFAYDTNPDSEVSVSMQVPYGYDWVSQNFRLGDIPLTVPQLSSISNQNILVRTPYIVNESFTDTDPNATSWTATVDYGDGSGVQPLNLSGMNFSLNNTYTSPGTYTITINVTNNLGETGTGYATVVVNPYVIQVNNPSFNSVILGDIYSQNDKFIDPDPNATSWTATVDYGDGSGIQPLNLNPDNTFLLSHDFSDVRTYTARINVTNNFGETGSTSVLINVNAPFTASNVSFDPVSHFLSFTTTTDWSTACLKSSCGARTLTVIDTNNRNIYQGTWAANACLGNGQCQIFIPKYNPNALVTTQFYMQVQLFSKMTIGNGDTSLFDSQLLPASLFASSPPQPPSVGTITFTPATPEINTSSSLSGSFTDPNTSDTHTATIDWGDGSATQSGSVTESNGSGTVTGSHTYTALGSHAVTVTVTDNGGLSGTSQEVVSVIPANGLAGGNLSHTNYSGADLSNQDISKANLSVGTFNNVDFASANLSQVNGSNSSFTNDNFTGANLNKVNLSNSNITGSNFTNAILTQGNLSNANLTNVDFTGANLQGANLGGTIKTGITWSNTTCPNGTNSNNDGGNCIGQGGGL